MHIAHCILMYVVHCVECGLTQLSLYQLSMLFPFRQPSDIGFHHNKRYSEYLRESVFVLNICIY